MWTTLSSPRRPEAVDLYNLGLGALLFVSPWLFAFAHGAAGADAWLGGAAIAALSLAALMVYAEWEEWITLAAGLWMILSPFVLGFTHTTGDARDHQHRRRCHLPRRARSLARPFRRGPDRALRTPELAAPHIFASGSKNSIMFPSGSAM
jgi:hypothetical protein